MVVLIVAHNQTPLNLLSCLQKCTPSHCPVCRGVYKKEKVKKLHVETTLTGRDEVSRASSPSVIAEYLQMVAMVSGEGVLDVEVEGVSAHVDQWIASLPQNLKLQVGRCFFTSAFSAFCFLPPMFDHAVFRGSTIVGSRLGDGIFFSFERSTLTEPRLTVATGPYRTRFGQTSQKTAARPRNGQNAAPCHRKKVG